MSLLLLAALSACQTVPTKTYEIRQRAFTYQPASLVRDYQEEYAYIEQRRQTVMHGESNGVADHVPLVDRKSTRLNSSHMSESRMPSSA